MASFLVPLNINKLDLKDYLYNAYSLPILSIRSYVIQQRVRQDKPGAKLPKPRRWFRPRALKKMTIEMATEAEGGTGEITDPNTGRRVVLRGGPFVWPEEERNLEAWDKKTYDEAAREQRRMNEQNGPDRMLLPKADRRSIAEQARALLEGREVWRPSWRDYGAVTGKEVEVDMDVDRDLTETTRR